MAERVHPLKLASLLLQYPSADLREAADAARELEIAPTRGRQAERLHEFCGWYAARPLAELQRLYVDAFDFTKQCSLHLSYHVHGDRRQRGVALVALKDRYRAAGFEPPGTELPDYLPLMLEFAALVEPVSGAELLEQHRVAIELVRAGLQPRREPVRAAARGGLRRPRAAELAEARPDSPARRRGAADRGGRARAVRAPRGDAGRRARGGPPDGRWVGGDVTRGAVLLYVVLPYAALAVFVVGHWWRYRRDQYGWGARSTQLLESRVLKYASNVFHLGVLAAIGGHACGTRMPSTWPPIAASTPRWKMMLA